MAPNKIIFQIGVLAFCVTAVFLGIQNLSLMETVSRSFIVFVGVILTVALALVAGSMFITKPIVQADQPLEKEKKMPPREPAKRPEQTPPGK
jgi:hypothetical protein